MRTTSLLATCLAVAGPPAGADARDGFSTVLRCGERELEVTPTGQGLHLLAGFDRFELGPVPAASGARFEAPRDPGTWLWSEGEETRVAIEGEALPVCVAEPFRAGGNEPFWRIAIGPEGLLLERPGEPDLRAPAVAPAAADGSLRWSFAAYGATVVVEARLGLCRDTMTGMPHPARVTLSLGGRTLAGCGGDPGALLRRRAWQVASLDGAVLPGRRPDPLQPHPRPLAADRRSAAARPAGRHDDGLRGGGDGRRAALHRGARGGPPIRAGRRRPPPAGHRVRGVDRADPVTRSGGSGTLVASSGGPRAGSSTAGPAERSVPPSCRRP